MLSTEHLQRQTQQILPRAPGGLSDLLTSVAQGQAWPTATGFLPHISSRQESSTDKMHPARWEAVVRIHRSDGGILSSAVHLLGLPAPKFEPCRHRHTWTS